MPTHLRNNFLLAFSFILIAIGWLTPGSLFSAALTWPACLLLCYSLPRAAKPYRYAYIGSVAMYAIGFYWLFFTIRDFGGFSNLASTTIFALFLTVSALQGVLFVYVYRNLPRIFNQAGISIAAAWLSAEMLSIKIFPWMLGHSQLAYTYFAQVADIAGAAGISFLMLWIGQAAVDLLQKRRMQKSILVAALTLAAVNIYGWYRVGQIRELKSPTQEVALIQANISLEEKHSVTLPRANLERYYELSAEREKNDLLIIWPESVLTEFIAADIKHASDDRLGRVPFFRSAMLLLGSLTYANDESIFNSAIGIAPEGSVVGVYHKQILMPFGEYTPLSSTLPWLKEINSTAGEFTAGDEIRVFEFPDDRDGLKVSPLICYEDIIPELSRRAVNKGAELLINMTNDAWFGDTAAPLQHNLIASFRAIENRRYLLRSTNTGLTAIVDPLGKTIGSLQPYSEGVLQQSVDLIKLKSPAAFYNFTFWLKLAALSMFLISLANHLRNRRKPV